jgi:hypothetical protein
MLFKPPLIGSPFAIVDTVKREARTSLFHTSAETYNSETLDKSEALKTLLTELYTVKDLTVDRRH